ncbi:9262_t:CDS:2, partial [Acaulospora colombiana]
MAYFGLPKLDPFNPPNMSGSPPKPTRKIVESTPTTASPFIDPSDSKTDDDPATEIPLDELHVDTSRYTADEKGKGRAIHTDEAEEIRNYDLQEEEQDQYDGFIDKNETVGGGAYPPVGDDDIEERRVSETLKRWEEQERLRRKAAREANRNSNSQRNSVVVDVGRRASKLWKDGAQRRASLRKGAQKMHEDVNFEAIPSRRSSGGGGAAANGDVVEPSRSTSLSLQETIRSRSPSSPTPLVSENPFSTPRNGSPTSLLHERPASAYDYASRSKSPIQSPEAALMEETSNPPTPSLDKTMAKDPEYPDRPVLRASSSSYSATEHTPTKQRPKSNLPAPRPLDLPEEVTAPPQPPMRKASPVLYERSEADIQDDDELEAREAKEGRWWTDWICGCRESGRLGQDQPYLDADYYTVIAATDLVKRDVFRKPDPFVRVSVNANGSVQQHHTKAAENDCSPIWNESFDMLVSSQIFDASKYNRRPDAASLGVINVPLQTLNLHSK